MQDLDWNDIITLSSCVVNLLMIILHFNYVLSGKNMYKWQVIQDKFLYNLDKQIQINKDLVDLKIKNQHKQL